MTHALLTGSTAIVGVSGACEAVDQRAVPRPQGPFGGDGRDAMDGGPGRDVCNGGKKLDTARRCERVREL
jgi:hypothetical protein